MNNTSRTNVSQDVKLRLDGMIWVDAAKRKRPSKSLLLVALFTFPFSP